MNSAVVLGALAGGVRVLKNSAGAVHALELKLFCRCSITDILASDLQLLSARIRNGRWYLPPTASYPAVIPLAVFLGDSHQPVYQHAVLHPFPPSIDVQDFAQYYRRKDDVFPGGVLHEAMYELSDTDLLLRDTLAVTIKGSNGGFPCDPPSMLKIPGFPPIGVHLTMQRVKNPPTPKTTAGSASSPATAPAPPASSSSTSSSVPAPHAAAVPATNPSTAAPPPPPSTPPVAPASFTAVVRGEAPSTSGSGVSLAVAAVAPASGGHAMQSDPLVGNKRPPPSPCGSTHGSASGNTDAASISSEDTAMQPS